MPKCCRSVDELLPALLRRSVRSIISPSSRCAHIQLMIRLHTRLICYKAAREKREWRSVPSSGSSVSCAARHFPPNHDASTGPQDENNQLLFLKLTNKLGLDFADPVLHKPFGVFYCLHGKISFSVCFCWRIFCFYRLNASAPSKELASTLTQPMERKPNQLDLFFA